MKMLKFISILVLGYTLTGCTDTVKNVIILIPDGTSSSLLTLSRWYINSDNELQDKDSLLAFDPYVCGMIRTHNSDGKFPDSAPAATAYATGVKSNGKNVGMGPELNPRISVLGSAKLKGLSTGVVVTCEFSHATPASFVVSHFDRGDYGVLIKQFISNSPDLVFAGGKKYLDEHGYDVLLKPNKIKLITDKKSFDEANGLSDSCLWALFPDRRDSTRCMSYECDRDSAKAPGLAEMTDKAIKLLSKNKKGFFLMAEGSQIDWAAHNNDPYAAVTELLEFNKAVEVALNFAKKNKNTVVVICPDHGTGGICLGDFRSGKKFLEDNPTKYDNLNIRNSIVVPLKEIKESDGSSGRKLAESMLSDAAYISQDSLTKYYNIKDTTGKVLKSLKNAVKEIDEKTGFTDEEKHEAKTDTLQYIIGGAFSRENFIGWPTTGHTGEDVFLAIYAPKHVPKITGTVNNDSIGRYIAKVLNLGDLNDATKKLYTKHSEYFNEDEIISWDVDSLVVKKNGKELIFMSNSNVLKINGETKNWSSMFVRINEIYYLPESINNCLK